MRRTIYETCGHCFCTNDISLSQIMTGQDMTCNGCNRLIENNQSLMRKVVEDMFDDIEALNDKVERLESDVDSLNNSMYNS